MATLWLCIEAVAVHFGKEEVSEPFVQGSLLIWEEGADLLNKSVPGAGGEPPAPAAWHACVLEYERNAARLLVFHREFLGRDHPSVPSVSERPSYRLRGL